MIQKTKTLWNKMLGKLETKIVSQEMNKINPLSVQKLYFGVSGKFVTCDIFAKLAELMFSP